MADAEAVQAAGTLVQDDTKTISQGEKGGKRYNLWGFPITAVLRWMGKNEWKMEHAKRALHGLGITDVADPTYSAQLRAGKKGERGEPAKLTPEQIAELRKHADGKE